MSEPPDMLRFREAEALLKALGNATRLAIVYQLQDGPKCVHDLVKALDLPQPLISQHLRVLRTESLVTGTRHGQEMHYAIADDHVWHIAQDAIRHTREKRNPK